MSQDDVFVRLDKLDKAMSDLLAKMDQIKEAMLLHCDGEDAITTQLRRNIGVQPFKAVTLEQKLNKPIEVQLPNMSKLTWTKIPAPNNPKGPWWKCVQNDVVEFQEMVKLIQAEGKTFFNKSEQTAYWVNPDESLGRRTKK